MGVNSAINVDQFWSSSSLRIISLTSLNPPASLLTLLGLRVTSAWALSSLPLTGLGLAETAGPRLVGLSSFDALPAVVVLIEDGISSHSAPATVSFLRKKGQRSVRIARDSLASAVEIGTGEDLMMASATSVAGNARLFLPDGVPEAPVTGLENSIQTLSATPPSRPRRQRRRISSWFIFNIWSRVRVPRVTSLPNDLVGDAVRERWRTRSYKACLRDVEGV